jgi:hypothetical protein
VVSSNIWLLSFGDLVTLLLGFFVAIIAFALQNPPKPQMEIKALDGTTIAQDIPNNASRLSVIEVQLPASSFDQTTGELGGDEAKTLITQLNLSSLKVESVLLESCFEGQSNDRESIRFMVMGRALAIASQLVDAGVNAELIQIELPTGVCSKNLQAGGVKVTARGMVNNG